MSPWKLAFTHLWRKKLSSFLALAGIALSVATSGVLLRLFLLSQARFQSLAVTGDALVGAKSGDLSILLGALNLEGPYPDFIPRALYDSLAARQDIHFEDGAQSGGSSIERIVPFVIFARVGSHRVIGTTDLFVRTGASNMPSLAQGRWPESPGGVVLGSEATRDLGLKLGDSISVEAWVSATPSRDHLSLRVEGILAPTHKAWDRGLYSDLATAEGVFARHQGEFASIWKAKVLHYYLIYLRPERGLAGWEWLKSLVNQRTVAQVVAVDEAVRELRDLTGAQEQLGLLVSVVIVLLGALSITTLMITRFESMGQQLAVLRALGYSRRELSLILLFEALMIGGSAAGLGALLDGLVFPWLRQLLGENLPSPDLVSVGLWHSFPVWIAALVGCLISILLPLWRLWRQNIHRQLREIN